MIKKIIGRFPVQTLIRVACYLAIVALGLMVWSVVVPTALPVVIGMSVGQGIGILGFLCFLLAILGDTQRATPPPPPPESEP